MHAYHSLTRIPTKNGHFVDWPNDNSHIDLMNRRLRQQVFHLYSSLTSEYRAERSRDLVLAFVSLTTTVLAVAVVTPPVFGCGKGLCSFMAQVCRLSQPSRPIPWTRLRSKFFSWKIIVRKSFWNHFRVNIWYWPDVGHYWYHWHFCPFLGYFYLPAVFAISDTEMFLHIKQVVPTWSSQSDHQVAILLL